MNDNFKPGAEVWCPEEDEPGIARGMRERVMLVILTLFFSSGFYYAMFAILENWF